MRKQKVVFLITSLLISMFMFLTDSLPVTNATYVEQPISGATIIISAELGNFSSETGVTDLNGQCKFIFTAPAVEEETNVTITAVASKYGYKDAMAQSVITVEPKNMTVEVEIYPK